MVSPVLVGQRAANWRFNGGKQQVFDRPGALFSSCGVRILLIDTDSSRRQTWLRRLQVPSSDVTFVTSSADWATAIKQPRYALGIYCVDEDSSARDLDLETDDLIALCHWSIVMFGASQANERAACYRAGFDDCVTVDCEDALLVSRYRRARELQQTEQRLAQAQKLESIGELAAGIAHEINTPIQYVGDNTRFVQDACQELNQVLALCAKLVAAVEDGSDIKSATLELRNAMEEADVEYLAEEVPSAIGQSLEGVDRVANIVRAMKEFSHPGASEMTMTDIAAAIENTAMVARNEWKYVASMETSFDSELPLVPCLPGELNQVILNMIVNAAHAIAATLGNTPEAKGTIRISTEATPEHAVIRIRDTGQGVAPEHIEQIFKPFFTTKVAGKGTGQGLAIAHSVIVEKHHGKIEVESEVGRGTCFTIRLPLQQEQAEVDESRSLTASAI